MHSKDSPHTEHIERGDQCPNLGILHAEIRHDGMYTRYGDTRPEGTDEAGEGDRYGDAPLAASGPVARVTWMGWPIC